MKLKTYIARAVDLFHIPGSHRASNGSRQKFIMVQAANIKQVAELTNSTAHHLRYYGGIHAVNPYVPALFCAPHKTPSEITLKPGVVYYKCEHCGGGFINQWFEYTPKSS